MNSNSRKHRAIMLRKEGASFGEIAKSVLASKSTVSLWCRDIPLTKMQQQKLKNNMLKTLAFSRLKAAETNRNKKLRKIKKYEEEGLHSIQTLSKKEFLVAGLGLYWGEGSKSGKLSFINSDPELIVFMFSWFQKIMDIKPEDFMPRIFINEIHKNRINTVIDFWSARLGLPKEQFGNPTFLKMKQKKKYHNHDQYYGMLAIRVRNGTNLKYRILGLIEGLKRGI